MGKGKIPVEKKVFSKDTGLFPSAKEKILNNFKSEIFPTKNPAKILTSEQAPEPTVFDTKTKQEFSIYITWKTYEWNFKWWEKYKYQNI